MMKSHLSVGLCLILILVLSGFETALSYESVEVTGGGALVGKVTFAGTHPKDAKLEVTKNQDLCGSSMVNETMLIGPDGGVKNAVVTIEGIESGKSFELGEYILDNSNCLFVPHVQVIPRGQSLQILNSDPILHNTHAYLGTATVFNLALPLKDQKVAKRMKRPGVLSVKCDAGHTWMSAYIVVVENPYYAVTDESGAFEIGDIPPGTYQVKAWHEELGTEIQEVVIKGGESTNQSFTNLAK